MAELEFELGEEFSFTTHMMSGAVAGYFEVNFAKIVLLTVLSVRIFYTFCLVFILRI